MATWSEKLVNIIVNSLHPGFIVTNLFRNFNMFTGTKSDFYDLFDLYFKGAATTCYLALNPKVNGITKRHFSNSNLAEPSQKAKDSALAKGLWDFSLRSTSSK
ncbi:hypothetical protein OSB04_009886 [Centaurea solstitialis]|uniref:Uncharacterized protein n=1 Tax=Centaurea solstitialis TaxID=347529 RepID=A0AA38WCB3_9ASTR|nr:hypothetical protein OSB04_009886 [Centaurea solstitialis]